MRRYDAIRPACHKNPSSPCSAFVTTQPAEAGFAFRFLLNAPQSNFDTRFVQSDRCLQNLPVLETTESYPVLAWRPARSARKDQDENWKPL